MLAIERHFCMSRIKFFKSNDIKFDDIFVLYYCKLFFFLVRQLVRLVHSWVTRRCAIGSGMLALRGHFVVKK